MIRYLIIYNDDIGTELWADDISFKDFFIRATNDENGRTLYIPYTSIKDIEKIGTESIKEAAIEKVVTEYRK